jgi:predicted phage tail protein
MLTKVRLYGVMGKKFGKEWMLNVSSPSEALRMIEANKPGLTRWMIENKETYDKYRVTCINADGIEEDLNDDSYSLERGQLKEIRFAPLTAGASGVVKIFVGVILVVAGLYFNQPWMVKIGAALILGGVIEALSPRPNTKKDGETPGSYYFDGAANTQRQGSPVPLIYGRVLAGSQTISASISIDEVAA